MVRHAHVHGLTVNVVDDSDLELRRKERNIRGQKPCGLNFTSMISNRTYTTYMPYRQCRYDIPFESNWSRSNPGSDEVMLRLDCSECTITETQKSGS